MIIVIIFYLNKMLWRGLGNLRRLLVFLAFLIKRCAIPSCILIENIPCHATLSHCHTHECGMLALNQAINVDNIDGQTKNQVD